MAVHIRKDGFWSNITYNIPPLSVSGNWIDETSNRFAQNSGLSAAQQAQRVYTNNTGKLILVRAVPGVTQASSNNAASFSQLSGSFATAYVDGQPVSRYRDNGKESDDEVRYELQFFVPNYSEYYVQCSGPPASWVTTLEWYEFIFQ